jgi:hypothetical protein
MVQNLRVILFLLHKRNKGPLELVDRGESGELDAVL